MPDKDPFDNLFDEISKLVELTNKGIANLGKGKKGKEDENSLDEIKKKFSSIKEVAEYFMKLNQAFIPEDAKLIVEVKKSIHQPEQLPEEGRRILERTKKAQREVSSIQKDLLIASAISEADKEIEQSKKKKMTERKKKFRRVKDDKWKRI